MENFIIQAEIYLFVAIITVAITTKMGLGSVLGYLVAGVLLGSMFDVAGTEAHLINDVAEIGVVMMLFLIGIELEPKTLWKMRHHFVGLGIAQLTLSTMLIAGSFYFAGFGYSESIAIGLILALSSTAIVLQTLNEKKLLHTKGGRAIFSVLIMQDIAVVPILIILPFLAFGVSDNAIFGSHGHGAHIAPEILNNFSLWGKTILMSVAMGGIVLFGLYGVPWIFHVVNMLKHHDLHVFVSFIIVLSIALLMVGVGAPPALGTFIAGVVLANSPFKPQFMADIMPFKGFFIGLFFITVGIDIDFSTVIKQPRIILSYTMIFVFAKMLVLFMIAFIFKIKNSDRLLFTFGLAQGGEFGLLLFSFITAQHLIEAELSNQLLIAIAFSMFLAPFLFKIYEWCVQKFYPEDAEKNKERQHNFDEVIIAGINRFSQIVSKILMSAGYRTVLVDNDLEIVQTLRWQGVKCFFGNPTRPKLLYEAGLEHAKVLVVSIRDIASACKLISFVRWSQPNIHIVARARKNTDYHKLQKAGAHVVVRENFESSVCAGQHALEGLGVNAVAAKTYSQEFYEHELNTVWELSKFWGSPPSFDKNNEFTVHSQQENIEGDIPLVERLKNYEKQEKKDKDA